MTDYNSVEVSEKPIQRWEYYLVVIIFLVVGVVAFKVASRESITVDEVIHIPAGVSYLEQNDARMNPEHPPLIKVIAAVPLVLGGLRLDYSLPEWGQSRDALFGFAALSKLGPPSAAWILLARIPMIAVMLCLGYTIFWMARRLAGPVGGFFALFIFSTTPFFYAYGPLVHTDIGIALFALLAVWTFVSVWRQPDWPHAIRFGFCFAGALLTKFTSGLLLPCFIFLAFWFAVKRDSGGLSLWHRIRFSLAGVALASLIVYFSYLVLFWRTKTADMLAYRFAHSKTPIPAMQRASEILHAHPWVERLVSPLVNYFLGVGHTVNFLPRNTYLMGKVYAHGTPAYFPTLFLFKMPLGFLFLLALLVALVVAQLSNEPRCGAARDGYSPDHLTGLVVLFFVYSLAALLSPLNLGIRHISVPITVLVVLMALVVPLTNRLRWEAFRRLSLSTIALALLGNATAFAISYPNYIPYFNSLLGKHAKFEVAADSNLDWGQTLLEVRRLQGEHPSEKVAFDIEGSIPSIYLQGALSFDCEDGIPAGVDWVAIGATRFVNLPDLITIAPQPDQHCRQFFRSPYSILAGGSLYVFHVPRDSEASK